MSFAINNSYLPDIAYPEQQDGISAKGFSLGYVGSVILLVFNLFMVMEPEFFGITDSGGEIAEIKAMKYSFSLNLIASQLASKQIGISKVVNRMKNNEIPSTPK